MFSQHLKILLKCMFLKLSMYMREICDLESGNQRVVHAGLLHVYVFDSARSSSV